MDESVEANNSDVISTTSNMATAATILGVIKRIIGGFILSDEEKLQAGINTGNFHVRHDMNQASAQSDSFDEFRPKGRIV